MLFTVLNSLSVRNKTLSMKDFTVESDIDVLAFTETWLSDESDEYIIRDLCPTGYEFYNVPRGLEEAELDYYTRRELAFRSSLASRLNSDRFSLLIYC